MEGENIVNHTADLYQLLQNVPEVHKIGAPGLLSVFGPKAFPFLVGKHQNCYHPLGGAARYFDGRIVIYSHDGYLVPTLEEESNLNQLILNNVRWCCNNKDNAKIKIGVYNNNQKLVEFLKKNNFSTCLVTEKELSDITLLKNFDLICIQNIGCINAKEVEEVKKFIKNGRGLFAANTAWAWDHYGPSGDIRYDHPGNSITHAAGLGWTTSGYLEGTSTSGGFSTEVSLLTNSHVGDVWNLTKNVYRGIEDLGRIKNVMSILEECLKSIPYQDEEFLPKIISEFEGMPIPIPCKDNPVTDPLAKLLLTLKCTLSNGTHCSPRGSFMTKCFDNFPGKVEMNIEPLHNEIVHLDINAKGMFSTGIYSNPGEILTVEL